MIRTLLASSALALIALPACSAQTLPATPVPQLSLTAQSQAEIEPDFATVRSGTVTRGETAAEAVAANAALMERVFTALRRAGVESDDMQTAQLSVSPVYSDRRVPGTYINEIVGYEARNTVIARIDEIESVGEVIDAMVSAGANNIQGVSFGADETEEAMNVARRDAVAQLLERAQLYADAAGFELCGILRMSEGFSQPRPVAMPEMAMARMASADTPIAAGQLTLTASVSADFCIRQD